MKRWAIIFLLLATSVGATERLVPLKMNHTDYDSAKIITYPAGDRSKADTSTRVTIPLSTVTSLNDDTTWVLRWQFFSDIGDTLYAKDVIPSAASNPLSYVVNYPITAASPDFDSVVFEIYPGPGYSSVSVFRLGLPADTFISLNMGHNTRIYELYTSTTSSDTVSSCYSIAHMPGDTSGFPVASTASTCRLYGTIRTGDGEAVPFARVTATVEKGATNTCDSTLMVGRSVRTWATSTGYFEIDLAWSSCLSDTTWTVTVDGRHVDESYQITVPDSTGHRFYDLVQ